MPQDIAVRQEGRYRLRYRIFNIAGAMHGGPSYNVPILAECYGGAFEVYSTKSFPGLQASTNLTKVSLFPHTVFFLWQCNAC